MKFFTEKNLHNKLKFCLAIIVIKKRKKVAVLLIIAGFTTNEKPETFPKIPKSIFCVNKSFLIFDLISWFLYIY